MGMPGDKGWLLALDLSTPRGLLILNGPAGLLQREIEGDSRVSYLFVAAREMLHEAGIPPRGLSLLGVGGGPGSFTGVRVAVTAAKFMAAVLELPLVAPDSLMVTAAGVEAECEAVFAAIDARRGEVYYALYHMDDGYPVALYEPCVSTPQTAYERLTEWMEELRGTVVMAGSGIGAYAHMWPDGLAKAEGDLPDARGLARLCRLTAERGLHVEPLKLLPFYLRRPDAQERVSCGEGG
jgi:tRNA threonylcarbamoyladenosine biosynthesis protein TsaB